MTLSVPRNSEVLGFDFQIFKASNETILYFWEILGGDLSTKIDLDFVVYIGLLEDLVQ